MKFADRLRKLRAENKLKQEELAKKFNTSKAAISNYENDYRKPNMDLISDLADFFDVSVDYLLGKTNIRKTIPAELQQFLDEYGIEYIAILKYAHEKCIPPEDIKVIIDTFEEIKPILDRLSN